MITPEIIKKFQQILKEKRDYLEKKIKELRVVTDFGDGAGSVDEEVDESAQYDNQLSLMQNFKDQLVNVEGALNKMSKNKYGVCEKCRQEIDDAVLKADPESRLCRQCKQKINKLKEK